MHFVEPAAWTVVAFLVIVACVLAAVLAAVAIAARHDGVNARRRVLAVGAVLVGWLGVTAGLAESGFIAAAPMPRLPITFAVLMAVTLAFAFSRLGGSIARSVPLAALVGFQAFRLPLELVLHAWVEQGTIPESMTWTGHNLDIVSGVVALLAAPLATRWRAAAWIANLVGCGSFTAALDGSNLDHLTSLSLGREGGTGFGTAPSA